MGFESCKIVHFGVLYPCFVVRLGFFLYLYALKNDKWTREYLNLYLPIRLKSWL